VIRAAVGLTHPAVAELRRAVAAPRRAPDAFPFRDTMMTNLEEAQRLFKPAEPAPMTYAEEAAKHRANYERLKAERLAREAASGAA
jgi:hypothetical protein